jgi:ankyrin repeat protein
LKLGHPGFVYIIPITKTGKPISRTDDKVASPLYYASLLGLYNIVNRIIRNDPDLDVQSGCYGTTIQAAVVSRNSEVEKLLLETGADVNIQGGLFGTAIQAAAACRYNKVVSCYLNLVRSLTRRKSFGSMGAHCLRLQLEKRWTL